MSKTPEISEVWTARIYFKGKTGESKRRPVLVINVNEATGEYTIQEITTVKPDDPPTYYDGFKQIINKWKEANLDEESYVKCAPTNTHKVDKVRLIGYIGVTEEEDFEAIIEKIFEAKNKQK